MIIQFSICKWLIESGFSQSQLTMAFETNKERINALNGLGCLVKALVGRELTIDLRNETTLTGTVSEVDG